MEFVFTGGEKSYATFVHNNEKYEVDAVLNEAGTKIEWFDIFDSNGNCVNEGDPIYVDHHRKESKMRETLTKTVELWIADGCFD